jgi:hypothetical protein
MIIIQKQSNNCRSGRAHNHQEQKRSGRSEFNKEHAHCFFFWHEGDCSPEFVPPNTTVNFDFCCGVLRCLRENVQCERPELWCTHNWLLHHDNAPAHTSLTTTGSVPHYSPSSLLAGLSPLWFRFVSQIQNKTEGTMFWNSVWHPKGTASGTRHH